MNWVPILSLIVAIIAVFFGPLIAARSAKRAMIGPMRQKWINDLRSLLSEISSSCMHYWQTGYEDRTDEEYQRITDLKHQVIFMINPEEEDHQTLVSIIARMESGLARSKNGDIDFHTAYKELLDHGRKVLKREWKVVKST